MRRAQAEPLIRDVRVRLATALPLLRSRFGVGRVVLFGSFAGGIPSTVSDVDLAVEGLPAVAQFRAMAMLSQMLGRDVDVVRFEDLTAEDRDRILAAGEPL